MDSIYYFFGRFSTSWATIEELYIYNVFAEWNRGSTRQAMAVGVSIALTDLLRHWFVERNRGRKRQAMALGVSIELTDLLRHWFLERNSGPNKVNQRDLAYERLAKWELSRRYWFFFFFFFLGTHFEYLFPGVQAINWTNGNPVRWWSSCNGRDGDIICQNICNKTEGLLWLWRKPFCISMKQWSLIVLKCMFAISQWQWYLQTIVNSVIFNQAVIHVTKNIFDGILQVWQPCGRLMPTMVFSTRLVFCSYCESDPWRRVGARV